MGLFWYTRRMYRDFVLRVEWQERRRTDNSGVFIRFPDPGQDPWIAVRDGYEVQIYDEWDDPLYVTGAIYELAPARRVASLPPGEWNLFEITAEGPEISVSPASCLPGVAEGCEGAAGRAWIGASRINGLGRARRTGVAGGVVENAGRRNVGDQLGLPFAG
jgi:hypothetical protein